jgi:hypothetical protein
LKAQPEVQFDELKKMLEKYTYREVYWFGLLKIALRVAGLSASLSFSSNSEMYIGHCTAKHKYFFEAHIIATVDRVLRRGGQQWDDS